MGQAADLSGMKILVVEDNFLVADMLCEALREYGCEIVGPAPDVERGADLIESEGAEGNGLTGAVLDVNLNGDTSFPIASKLQARGIPFIFLTGYGDQALMPGEFQSARRVAKPCDIDELARLIHDVF
jgi:DNA-binding response OmpR family regulator